MQIEESDEHCENAERSMHASWQPDSNSTDESAVHFEKQS
jgi:hypothetical protein